MRWVNVIDWRINPFRADRWAEVWSPLASKVTAYGARSWTLERSTEDPLLFRQTSVWDDKSDFDRYWYDAEIQGARERTVDWYHKPLLPVWFQLVGEGSRDSSGPDDG